MLLLQELKIHLPQLPDVEQLSMVRDLKAENCDEILTRISISLNEIIGTCGKWKVTSTGNLSRNILPNIGKNVPDTMCGLGDIRNNF